MSVYVDVRWICMYVCVCFFIAYVWMGCVCGNHRQIKNKKKRKKPNKTCMYTYIHTYTYTFICEYICVYICYWDLKACCTLFYEAKKYFLWCLKISFIPCLRVSTIFYGVCVCLCTFVYLNDKPYQKCTNKQTGWLRIIFSCG